MTNQTSEAPGSTTNQPGLDQVRNAARGRGWIPFGRPKSLRNDMIAGVSGSLSNVPDGMANGAILGVNPVYGLYGAMIGPFVGGSFSSTQLMMVTTMAAASLSASQALVGLEGEAREQGLFAMVIVVGIFQILAGIFKLGRADSFALFPTRCSRDF